jgi:hypothetical protein
LVRITIFSWLSTRLHSSVLAHTTLSAPTRSPYSEKLLENEVETKKFMPVRRNTARHAPSSAMPTPKPW